MSGPRHFSQVISEGDGISIIAEVPSAEAARVAEANGAEAVVLRRAVPGARAATALPILWCGPGTLREACEAGADAVVLTADRADSGGSLEAVHAEALELGLDVVLQARDEDELQAALERLDPEIFLLAAADGSDGLERALELLPDVPAGKLAIAEAAAVDAHAIAILERAGVDAVIVDSIEVAGLLGA